VTDFVDLKLSAVKSMYDH